MTSLKKKKLNRRSRKGFRTLNRVHDNPLNGGSAMEEGRQQEKANMPCGRISEAENKCCVCVKDSELLPQMPFVAGLLIQCGTQNKTETEEQQKLKKRNMRSQNSLCRMQETLMRVSLSDASVSL